MATGLRGGLSRCVRQTSGVRQATPAYTWQKITEEYAEDGSPVFHGSILAGFLGQNESGVDSFLYKQITALAKELLYSIVVFPGKDVYSYNSKEKQPLSRLLFPIIMAIYAQ